MLDVLFFFLPRELFIAMRYKNVVPSGVSYLPGYFLVVKFCRDKNIF
jgi:hypothetical protein